MKNKPAVAESFPIVAIGCSAGGLEAVIDLLNNLTPTTGMAYVLIQHLDPTHESMLSAILSKKTLMPVKEAGNNMLMECDHFYVIPPNADMALIDGHIILEPRPKNQIHMPIDIFFMSLAEIRKENAIGVLLSGGANDGTLGFRAIREAGGLTMAQDESAKFQSMPKSAIAEGVVDFVLSPKDIAFKLIELGNYLKDCKDHQTSADEKATGIELQEIFQLLKKEVKVDFNHYKTASIARRINRRMLLTNVPTLKDYIQHLKNNEGETKLLYNDILINVTRFFRDTDAYKYLQETLIPTLYKSKQPDEPVRIWVPACSTGQEAYSVAMILCEVQGAEEVRENTQIFGTDLSEQCIKKARLGIYSKSEVADVSPERLERFFEKVNGHYRINKTIRDICVFAPHNVLNDPPFSRIDLVSCCNLFIYLDASWQKKVLDTFHYALNSNGYLMLGKSETIGNSAKFFKQIDKEAKVNVYRRDIAVRQSLKNYASPDAGPVKPERKNEQPAQEPNLGQTIDTLLLTSYVTPCVVINRECEILEVRGSTGAFLEPAAGNATLNLLKMARPGLRIDLRTAIHKCIKTGNPVRKDGLEVKTKTTSYLVSIEVTLVNMQSSGIGYLLVLFYEYPSTANITVISAAGKKQIQYKLEQEITTLREDMTAIIEDREAANEELQTANEEIVSSNEELHTVNEELQTSKEEMESSNEELNTINEQLHARNEQLTEVHAYSEGMVQTIAEAMIVVDKNLIVKSANESFYRIFKTNPEVTEGHYLFDLGNGQWNIPKLRELLFDVVPKMGFFHGFEVTHEFPGIGNKIMSLNARLLTQKVQKEELIFIAIQDITEHIKAAKIIKEEEWFHNMANNAPVMIWAAGADGQYTFFNRTFLEFTGRTAEEEKGIGWLEDMHPDDTIRYTGVFNSALEQRMPFGMEYRLKRHDGIYRWMLVTGKPIYNENKFTSYLGTCTDIHDQKMSSRLLELKVKERTEDLLNANNNLKRSNEDLEQYAYVASHDLQEPLRKIQTFSDILQHKYCNDLPNDCRHYIHKIAGCAERMGHLIEDLLNFSSVSNSTDPFVPLNLNDIVTDVMENFEIEGTNTTITYNDLPVINAVPLQMRQLFHNLVSNAVKFRKAFNPLTITITARTIDGKDITRNSALDRQQQYHEIVFSDNGIGFNEAHAEQIFVIFKRLHDAQNYKGTGIGLALCRKILNNHHGEIYAESKNGNGASFHLIFPMLNHGK